MKLLLELLQVEQEISEATTKHPRALFQIFLNILFIFSPERNTETSVSTLVEKCWRKFLLEGEKTLICLPLLKQKDHRPELKKILRKSAVYSWG